MKNLLKGLPKERQLDYSKTFSQQSKNVHENLIPELKRMMMGHYNPSVTQLTDWLRSIHKHRRDRLRNLQTGKLNVTDRRTHKNARLSEVSDILFKSISFYVICCCLIFLYTFNRKKIGVSKRP
jgi:uncharacterized protein YktB (UPF0637 family)